MSRLRKVFFHGQVVFVTMSVEEGLMFPPNPLINAILESCLARAQKLHPVRVCHHLFESTHGHLMLMVDDPDDIKDFIDRFKTESAHAVNRLLGRKKRTVWCEGYDSPVLGTVKDVIREIAYIYTNPAKDSLCDSVDEYPGINSWKAYITARGRKKMCPWIRRSAIFELPHKDLTISDYSTFARRYKNLAEEEHSLEVFPDDWMECFGIYTKEEKRAINEEIVAKVREIEGQFRASREADGRSVLGVGGLRRKPIGSAYTPQRSGRKSWIICSDIEYRIAYIEFVKGLVDKAVKVYLKWKMGDFSEPFPPGLFPPCMPKLANAMPVSLY